jgi:UrcA family protein
MFRTLQEMSAMRRYMNMKTAVPGLLLASLLGSLGACTDAVAADQGIDVASRRVSYADLDLSRDAGAATLYSRIRFAARQVCEPTFGTFTWKLLEPTSRCIELAITRAVADVNAPALTSYHFAKTGQAIHLAEK